MKIQYASDLHLEFPENKKFLKKNPLKPIGDILILSGDILLLSEIEKHNDFFNYLSDNFKLTYWIPGNHEYYHYDITQRMGTLDEKIRSNVKLVNNICEVHDDIVLIFYTLWSKIRFESEFQIKRGVMDFHAIRYGKFTFTPERFNQLHDDSLKYIQQEISIYSNYKKVIATHHVPTLLNYPAKYKGSVINDAFATELFNYIETSGIHSWIFGHHHSNVDEFSIGKTKMLTNQFGYLEYGECANFNDSKILEL